MAGRGSGHSEHTFQGCCCPLDHARVQSLLTYMLKYATFSLLLSKDSLPSHACLTSLTLCACCLLLFRPHHSTRPCMDNILASAPAAITTDRTASTQEGKQGDSIAAVAAPSTPRAAAAIAAATEAGNVAVSVVISPNNSRHTQKDRDEAEKPGDAAVAAAAAGSTAADGAAEQPGVTLEQAEDVVNPLTTFPTTRKGSVSTLNHAGADSKRWCKPLSHLEDQALFMQRWVVAEGVTVAAGVVQHECSTVVAVCSGMCSSCFRVQGRQIPQLIDTMLHCKLGKPGHVFLSATRWHNSTSTCKLLTHIQ